jgi:hypothetical protein
LNALLLLLSSSSSLFVVATAALLVNILHPFLMLHFSLVETFITTRMPLFRLSHLVTAVSSHLELSWVLRQSCYVSACCMVLHFALFRYCMRF